MKTPCSLEMRLWLFILVLLGISIDRVDASTVTNPVVADGQIGDLRHGTYPSIGVGDGDWTHVGVDLAAPCGSRVRAFADGQVTDVIDTTRDPNFDSLGYMALIEHPASLLGKTFYTLYLHLEEPPSVKKTGRVTGGKTVIGRVGATGTALGCHTHFEVRYFPKRFFPEWGNIYGRGDQRGSELLTQNWADPLALFAQHPHGLSVASREGRTGPDLPDEAGAAAGPPSPLLQGGQAPAIDVEASVPTAEQPTAQRAVPKVERQPGERLTVAVPSQKGPAALVESTSVWVGADGTCTDSKTILIRNSLGVIIFYENDTILIETGSFLPEREKDLVQCPDLPGNYYALFGEAIALFRAAGSIARKCEAGDDGRCLEAAFGFVDVTGDGQLTAAEIARVIRALSFFVGYGIAESQKKKSGGGPVKLGDVVLPVALANLLSPLFANSLIDSYDFDGNEAISLEELLQDRGPDKLVGAMGTTGAAAVQAGLKGLLQTLLVAVGAMPGIVGLF